MLRRPPLDKEGGGNCKLFPEVLLIKGDFFVGETSV